MHKRISINSDDVLRNAAEVIRSDDILVYPTDTLYGFGVDATNKEAILKLNTLKERSGPISVIAANKDMALSWLDVSNKELNLAKSVLGGATTLIAQVKQGIVHPLILGENHTLGIRIPDHSFAPQLVAELGIPITTTSVNRSGQKAFNDPNEIHASFHDDIALIVDDGILPKSPGSHILKIENNTLIQLR